MPSDVAPRGRLSQFRSDPVFGRSVMLFDGANREQVVGLGEVRRPSIADLFVAVMSRGQNRAVPEIRENKWGRGRSQVGGQVHRPIKNNR